MKQFLPKIFTLVACLSINYAWSQTITGRVLDAKDNTALPGATVSEKGTSNGVSTDFDGNFSIKTTNFDAILIIRYVGFSEKEVAVAGRSTLEITLGEDENTISQVVVVGYGTQQKSDLTGAVSSVKSKELARVPTANVEQALQGKIAGVYVTPASGSPGAGAVIRIRGTGSLNNSNPIFVIDGMITSDASFVNPQDVASVEVLKDASACAIYGARGANGVIIITTKNGKTGQNGQISLSSYAGSQAVTRQIAMANASEFAKLYNQYSNSTYFKEPAALGVGTNYHDEIFQNAPISNIQLSASGGTEKYSYNISGGYFKQGGVVKNTKFDRLTFRINNEMRVKSWLSFGSNLSITSTKDQNAPSSQPSERPFGAPGVVGTGYRMPPVFAPKDSTGNFSNPTFFGLAIANPSAQLFYGQNNFGKGIRLVGNAFTDINFLKYFKFRSSFGVDFNQTKGRAFEPKYRVSGSQLNNADRLNVWFGENRNWIWEQTLHFDRKFGENHRLNVLAGYTSEERANEYFGASRENFPGTADELLYLSSGNDTTQMNSGGAGDEALVSYLFRTNYTFRSRYLVTFSMRADQSSRFQAANRTGIFPSIGLGWNLGQEEFIANLGIFDRLKLRFSTGILGNQNATGGQYPTVAAVENGLYGVFGTNEDLNYGATLTSISNPNLKWESTKQTDIGLETGFFKNKLELEVDFYNRQTYDIIAAVPIPDYVGSANDPVVNTAQVRNRGMDLTINWRENGRFSWNFGGTFSPVNNKVVKLANGKNEIFDAFLQGEPATRTAVGLPIGAFFGYQSDGVFQNEAEIAASPKFGNEKPGDLRFKDLNGDGKLSTLDRTKLGSPIPNLTWNLTGGVEFLGFDIAADLFAVRGNKVFNAKKTFRFAVYNWEKSAVDGWTSDQPSLTEPRTTNGGGNYRISDFFLEDGSFVRLRSVVLGYSLPKNTLKRLKMNKLRMFVSGNNLWTKQAYSGYSPEFPNGSSPYKVGFDEGGFPVAKSFQGGVEVVF